MIKTISHLIYLEKCVTKVFFSVVNGEASFISTDRTNTKQQIHDEAFVCVLFFSKCQILNTNVRVRSRCQNSQSIVFIPFNWLNLEKNLIWERGVCVVYIHICVLLWHLFAFVNSDIVLGRRKQFYLKRLCAYNSFSSYSLLEWKKEKKLYLFSFCVCICLCMSLKIFCTKISAHKKPIQIYFCCFFYFSSIEQEKKKCDANSEIVYKYV